ncbi:MAG: hypothetical protein NC418_08715 [Muribaculaceae bacterium]|nr:hypothetical protein [Muribaculaceae bacterium]
MKRLIIYSLLILMAASLATTAHAGRIVTPEYTYVGGLSPDGVPQGYGVAHYSNGTVYYGLWNKGRRDGIGRMLFTDGTFEFGTWQNGTYRHQKGQKFIPGRLCYGIDVSRYQKTVDWETLALNANASGRVVPKGKAPYKQPVLFALMKSTQGTTIKDPTFERNFSEAKRCGIIRGAYHFLSVSSPVEDQVKFFIANTPLEAGDLPPVLDLEISKDVMAKQHAKVVTMARKWLTLIERHYGVKPIIYTYNNYYIDYLRGHGLDGYDYWIARYGAEPSARHWEIWQFTETGKASGIKDAAVDIDYFRGDYRDLQQYVKQKGIHRNYTRSRKPASARL